MFTAARDVQSTEVTPAGRLRLDALARYLQQAAEDDVSDAGWDSSYLWLLRRVALAIRGFPGHGSEFRCGPIAQPPARGGRSARRR